MQRRLASSKPQPSTEPQSQQNATKDEAAASTKAPKTEKPAVHHKTMAELDEEMKAKMSGISGDGGSSGVEYEDGEPVSMKRSVKNNMFRYI